MRTSAAATNADTPLVMAVHVAPSREADGPQAKHLIGAQPADRRPKRILGDTACGNGLVERQMPVPDGATERPDHRSQCVDVSRKLAALARPHLSET